jgi:hypothetical protein
MSSTPLRNRLIRIAHANPELRKDLLPLLKGRTAASHGSDSVDLFIARSAPKFVREEAGEALLNILVESVAKAFDGHDLGGGEVRFQTGSSLTMRVNTLNPGLVFVRVYLEYSDGTDASARLDLSSGSTVDGIVDRVVGELGKAKAKLMA